MNTPSTQTLAAVAPATDCSRLLDQMMARHDITENLYKKMEEHLPCEPMTDEMLAAMNKSLGFSGDAAKTRDYRPYCVRESCKDWPRMMRVKEGFRCWSCQGIWDLSSENDKRHPVGDMAGGEHNQTT